jgi:putative transcriptional regulator
MTKEHKPLFQRLKAALQQGIAHHRGDVKLKSIEVPEEPPEIDASNLAALRQAAQMSQTAFAQVLNVSAKTVQSWEQGVRTPSMSSRRLIHVFSQRPEVVCEIVGVKPVTLSGVKIKRIAAGKRQIVVVDALFKRKRKPMFAKH